MYLLHLLLEKATATARRKQMVIHVTIIQSISDGRYGEEMRRFDQSIFDIPTCPTEAHSTNPSGIYQAGIGQMLNRAAISIESNFRVSIGQGVRLFLYLQDHESRASQLSRGERGRVCTIGHELITIEHIHLNDQ